MRYRSSKFPIPACSNIVRDKWVNPSEITVRSCFYDNRFSLSVFVSPSTSYQTENEKTRFFLLRHRAPSESVSTVSLPSFEYRGKAKDQEQYPTKKEFLCKVIISEKRLLSSKKRKETTLRSWACKKKADRERKEGKREADVVVRALELPRYAGPPLFRPFCTTRYRDCR